MVHARGYARALGNKYFVVAPRVFSVRYRVRGKQGDNMDLISLGGNAGMPSRAWSRWVYVLLACFALWVGLPGIAQATCASPQTATIANGGHVEFNCFEGAFQETVVAPMHGTISQSGSTVYSLTYAHDGGTSTSDTFTVVDENGDNVEFDITIQPGASPLTVSPATLPPMSVGVAYNQPLSTSGGVQSYTYSLAGGILPPGITLTSTGLISGTSTGSGAYTFTVHVVDSTPGTPLATDKAYTVSIADPTLVVTPTTLPAAAINRSYTTTLSTTGGTAPYTYVVDAGSSAPPGLSLSSAGVFSGTPTANGTFTTNVRVTDTTTRASGGTIAKIQAVTLTVAAAPTIVLNPPTLPGGTYQVAYTPAVTASGGTTPYTFAATGTLPPGVTLGTDGALSGSPTAVGTFNFNITATDANAFTGSQAYSVTINAAAPGAPSIASISVAAGAPGTLASATVNITPPANNGGSAITTYTVTANPGTLVGQSSGTTVTVNGLTRGTAYTFKAVATNAQGDSVDSATAGPITPQITQTITFNNPGTQNYGTTPTLTATVDTNRTLAFDSTTIDVCTIGRSTGQLTFVKAGTCSITVSQAGDATYVPASVSQSFTVQGRAPGAPTVGVIVVPDAPAGQSTGSASVNFTAPADSGGTPITSYTVSTGSGGPSATGAGSPIIVTGLTLGTPYQFTVQATNTDGPGTVSTPSSPVTAVGLQTITFNNPGSVPFGSTTTLNASSTSGLTVALAAQTPNTCEIRNTNQVFAKAPGNCQVQATQAGSTAYRVATPVQQTFQVVVPGGAPTIATTTLPAPTRGASYVQNILAVNGAPPYNFVVSAGVLPVGLTLSPSGSVTGTVVSTGPADFTVQVTDQAGQQATQRYQFTIISPAFAFTPSSVPVGKVGVGYTATTLAASGGIAPYTYAVTSGTLPAGLSLSTAGVLSGTPTAAGTAPVTVTATDNYGVTGAQAYTVSVGEATPVAVDDSATVAANGSVTIPATANDTGGPITSVAISQPPGHGAVTVSGLNAVYVPAHDFFGTDTFRYTGTGPGGTSNVATVSVTVSPGAVPTAASHKATVLAGKPVTVHAADGATNGPFTAVTVTSAPAAGTVQVQGTDLIYTPSADASGDVAFAYTLSNAFGASAPAQVTITVNPVPVAPSLSASTEAGRAVQVDVTSAAHGGPFTAAAIVSLSPANAGSASTQASGSGYVVVFTPASTFSGAVQVNYTLANAYATSAPGVISIAVTARPDPSKDPEVLGVLSAQADEARRMATGQISNFQRRLEMLHSGGASGFTNGVTVSSASANRGKDAYASLRRSQDEASRRYLVQPDADSAEGTANATSQHGSLPGDISVWTGGAVNFGRTQVGGADNGTDFTTSGVSMGVDKQFSDTLAAGIGVGYGHDNTDVGNNGSRSAVDSYNVALYASFHPAGAFYTDALVGYQWLSFDSRRFVTGQGTRVSGSRDGKQWFASLSAGYNHRGENTQLTPYARLDAARASLDPFTEHGDDFYALSYRSQTVKTATATVGVLAQWSAKRDYGIWAPQLRAEFGHDKQGASQAAMRYADSLSGPLYRATLYQQSRNHTQLGAGVALQTNSGWMLRAEYQLQLDNTSRDNQSILLGIEKKFGP